MALEQVSATVKSSYINEVSGYSIQYNVTQDEGQNAQIVTGFVKKADIRFGYVSIGADGTKNINFEKGISDEDSVSLYNAILADAKAIFAERNKA